MTDLDKAWKKRQELRSKARKFWEKANVHMVRKVQMASSGKTLAKKKAESLQNLCRSRGDVLWSKADLGWAKALIAVHGPGFSDVKTVYRERDYDYVVAGKVFRHSST
jgi:hypothetical protein